MKQLSRKVLTFITAAMSAYAMADDAVLWWMVDDSATITAQDGTFISNASEYMNAAGLSVNAARVRVSGEGISGDVFLHFYYEDPVENSWKLNGTEAWIESSGNGWSTGFTPASLSGHDLAGLSRESLSFSIELGNIADSGWTTLATSQSAGYAALLQNNHVSFSDLSSAGATAWTPMSYAIPEPSGAILLMLGTAFLALRRRRLNARIVLIGALVFSADAFAAMDDLLIKFSTQGPDRYADGTVVADGETYALVWTAKGAEFAGFNADGTLCDPDNSKLALLAPVAESGHCPKVMFSLRQSFVKNLPDGSWSVYLLDTRTAAGSPAQNEDAAPSRVNRWGLADASIVACDASSTSSLDTSVNCAFAETCSQLPASTPAPRISGITLKDGRVILEVENTVDYLTYNLEGGETPVLGGRHVAKAPKDGSTGRKITLEADATSKVGFFKVVRSE
jgi:hypothetical protein